MDGRPGGPPEWPRRGGLSKQSAKLVAAVTLLRNEWDRWNEAEPAKTVAPQKKRWR